MPLTTRLLDFDTYRTAILDLVMLNWVLAPAEWRWRARPEPIKK